MADLRISAEIIGLNEELEKETKRIEKQVPKALQFVGAELRSDLQDILEIEWQQKYEPQVYKRRTNNSSYGTPIGSDENFETIVTKNLLDFDFTPDVKHSKHKVSLSDTGDEMIEWIQGRHIGYESDIPARPFWNIFLDKQSNGGLIEKFIRGMSPYEVIGEPQDSNIDLSEFRLGAIDTDVTDGDEDSRLEEIDDDGLDF